MTTEEFVKYLEVDCAYKNIRVMGTEYVCIYPLIFTHAIIKGTIGNLHTFDDRWCYRSYKDALAALNKWDGTGEPEGWHRHPATGRRRKDGLEYINF
jgi:hypothetical protein